MTRKNYLIRQRVIDSVEEVQKLIDLIEYYDLKVITIGRGGQYKTRNEMLLRQESHPLSDYMIIELKDTVLEITTKYYEYKPTTYKFSLNDKEIISRSGHQCFAQLNRMFEVVKAKDYNNEELERWFNEEQGKYVCSTSPILNYNKKFEGQDITDCYEYDLNSAYFSTLLDVIPDLKKPTFKADIQVKKGFIGFIINDQLTLVESGGHADVVFPLIKTPEGLKRYCEKWYKVKQTSKKDSQQREDAKAMLNLPIGYCQRYNPFLRSYVIHKCNSIIRNLLDKNSLFWNTDAIFSKERRTDLEIGDKIGQFKEIKINTLRYVGNVYQTDNDYPKYRGIPKSWFKNFEKINKRPFNLLTDDVPGMMNNYRWNWNTLKLEEIDYEK